MKDMPRVRCFIYSLLANCVLATFLASSFPLQLQGDCLCWTPPNTRRIELVAAYAVITPQPPSESSDFLMFHANLPCPSNPGHTADARVISVQPPPTKLPIPLGTHLCVHVDERGQVTDLRVTGGNIDAPRRRAIQQILSGVRFRPANAHGRALASWSELRIDRLLRPN